MALKMTDDQLLEFVHNNALALGLPTEEARLSRVATHFKRTLTMAELLDQVDYPAELEIAEIYCPKKIST
jgi:hypothetical protein